LNEKVAVLVLKPEINGRWDPLLSPRDTLCPQKFALASLTSGGRSVGIVRLRTTSHEVLKCLKDRLCGLVVRVSGYRSRGPGFNFLRNSGSGTGSTQPREDN
jgi:hypothetical protein